MLNAARSEDLWGITAGSTSVFAVFIYLIMFRFIFFKGGRYILRKLKVGRLPTRGYVKVPIAPDGRIRGFDTVVFLREQLRAGPMRGFIRALSGTE